MPSSRDELIPKSQWPAVFGRSQSTVDRWVRTGALPVRKVPGSRSTYMLRSDIDAMLAPARRIAAEDAADEAAGRPAFSPEQIALVVRAVGDALAQVGQTPRAS